jgi:hypothetical protein
MTRSGVVCSGYEGFMLCYRLGFAASLDRARVPEDSRLWVFLGYKFDAKFIPFIYQYDAVFCEHNALFFILGLAISDSV